MNERRVIAVALVVIATVMVVNLFAQTERSAEAQTAAGPVEPAIVGMQVQDGKPGNQVENPHFRVWRLWSDGAVDTTYVRFPTEFGCEPDATCGPFSILPGSCASDITRNGAVEFADMLSVLEDWGPCPEKP